MHRGACLCGALRYEVDGPLRDMGHCHCSLCRKHHGSAFATYVAADPNAVRVLAGEHALASYRSSPSVTRWFCATCGAIAKYVHAASEAVYLPAGNLEGELGVGEQVHIFVGSKAPWYTISDAWPQHAAYPPEYESPPSVAPRTPAASASIAGSCLCGAVTYEFDGDGALGMRHCHCSRCRRGRSAAHGTNVYGAMDRLHITSGRDAIVTYKLPEALRFRVGFCKHCGGAAPHVSPERSLALIPAGTLDNDRGLRPDAHIFVGSKAPWFQIRDALPQHAEMSPA